MSDPAPGDTVAALFAAAIDLPEQQRESFVARARAAEAIRREVLSLLAVYERAQKQPEQVNADLAAAVLGEPIEAAEGRRIGPYRVLRELGRGGMGVVYLAERADGAYEQQVAIKLLPAALASAALADRFLLERQILAGLEHPGVARLLDGGVADHGEPYIVLEYVEGEPITNWCDGQRLAVTDRLRLFVKVCEVVQFAHGRLVVHRDLKPSNVLVTDAARSGRAQVKLLDFGIAKLLVDDGQTEATLLTKAGMRPYTPGYAAPEQLRGEPVTVATDVYGLGTLLYELLCGLRPHDADTSERRVEGDWVEPTRPSTALMRTAAGGSGTERGADPGEIADRRRATAERLRRRLTGDLDTIALKALREEPQRRYDSVKALADDIEGHLAGQPIDARPASVGYRARKFLRRHWLGATAAALVALAVFGGLASTIWQARLAARERDAAQAEAAKAEQVAEFLADVFRQANPLESKGEEMTVREALDRGAERIEAELAEQPIVQAELMAVLGGTYLELGDYARAEALLRRALDLRREHLGRDHPDVVEVLRGGIGVLRYRQGDYDAAIRVFSEALAIVERSQGLTADEVGSLSNNLGIVYRLAGRFSEAQTAYERALDVKQLHHGPASVEVGKAWLNYGTLLAAMREDERAREAYERALEIYERQLGPDHPYVAGTLGNIANLRMRHRDYDGLENDLRRMLSIHRTSYGSVHEAVGAGLKTLGDFLAASGRETEAIEAYEQSIDVDRQALGPDHPNVAFPLHGLGELHLAAGRPAAALAYAQEAVAIRQAALEPNNSWLAASLTLLGQTEAALNRWHEAEATLRRALESRRAAADPDPAEIASVSIDLAGALIEQARCDEARPLLNGASESLTLIDDADAQTTAAVDALLTRCPA